MMITEIYISCYTDKLSSRPLLIYDTIPEVHWIGKLCRIEGKTKWSDIIWLHLNYLLFFVSLSYFKLYLGFVGFIGSAKSNIEVITAWVFLWSKQKVTFSTSNLRLQILNFSILMTKTGQKNLKYEKSLLSHFVEVSKTNKQSKCNAIPYRLICRRPTDVRNLSLPLLSLTLFSVTYTHILSLFWSVCLFLHISFSRAHIYTHTLSLSLLSVCFFFSLTHTQTHTHTHLQSHPIWLQSIILKDCITQTKTKKK